MVKTLKSVTTFDRGKLFSAIKLRWQNRKSIRCIFQASHKGLPEEIRVWLLACFNVCRRRQAVHDSDSSSSSSSEDEEQFESHRKNTHNRDLRRCLPLNFGKDMLKRIHKDRMKIGTGLSDGDPMQTDGLVRFDGVGGLSDHIAALKEMVIFPLLYPEVFQGLKIQPPRGCLFYGPPGTGKTLVARALANECSQGGRRIAFFMKKGADCLSKWVGESERELRMLFDQAYRMRPSIIFFDEIDGLAPVRSSKQDQVYSSLVSTLLALMDGLNSRGEVVVIGATNRLDAVDPALRRPGRFDRELLFSLPNKESRKEIIKIHTQGWNPKPSDRFLEDLAEKCVGYCGADIKSLCAETALCALRRCYPQIYKSDEKLQLDINSIKITAKDFVVAMKKIVPSSQRAVTSPGQPLPPISKPLLENTLAEILQALQKVFPHAETALKENQQQDSLNNILRDDVIDSDEELPSIFEDEPTHNMPDRQKESLLTFSRNAHYQPTSCRPRFLITGDSGYGQASHLAPAVIHALEKFPVYALDLAVLFSSVTSPEETCAQLMREAQRTAPSIIYISHIHWWWEAVGPTLKATFITLLRNIPAFAPVLLLATSDVCHADLPNEIKDLFINDYEVFQLHLPNKDKRRKFFEDLIINQAAKLPASKGNAACQPLEELPEELPVALPPKPQELTEEEIRQPEEQKEEMLHHLRVFLRNVTLRLAADGCFRAFTKPVNPGEASDYARVIKQPMDLSTILSKIDLHQYLTAEDFLKDIDLICSNALEYNTAEDRGGCLIRHRACTLRDTTYAIVRAELDKDFEQCCEAIEESRKERGCSSSTYTPSYCCAMPKQNSVPVYKETEPKCNEKMKMPAAPINSSTPCSKGVSKRKHKKNKGSLGIRAKRRNFQFNKENKVPEEQNEVESSEESPEKHVSNIHHAEVEPTQDYSVEENENVLRERQKNGNENKSGAEDETFFLFTMPAFEKKSVVLPEPSDLRTNSEVMACQVADCLEEGNSNDFWVCSVIHERYSPVEEQQVIHVKPSTGTATQPTIVDYQEFTQLLHFVTVATENFSIFQLEKLYAVLSHCIYQHRKDYDKTKLAKAEVVILHIAVIPFLKRNLRKQSHFTVRTKKAKSDERSRSLCAPRPWIGSVEPAAVFSLSDSSGRLRDARGWRWQSRSPGAAADAVLSARLGVWREGAVIGGRRKIRRTRPPERRGKQFNPGAPAGAGEFPPGFPGCVPLPALGLTDRPTDRLTAADEP
ncbi:ATPase family AAA domain-containing protein 2-like [Athene noctua]|uniref:ATPase family AAA domain-containing protein 2-like n=1 Tax=Athene noctua TaxID=126797 RepID=UPI003EBD0F64